jgi:hypothetical protein
VNVDGEAEVCARLWLGKRPMRRFSKRSAGSPPHGTQPCLPSRAGSAAASGDGILICHTTSRVSCAEHESFEPDKDDGVLSDSQCRSPAAHGARLSASPGMVKDDVSTTGFGPEQTKPPAARTVCRRKTCKNLLQALQTREAIGILHQVARKAFLSNRGRLKYCLDDLVTSNHPATNSVILGFSGDGQALIGYTASTMLDQAGYAVEIWGFAPPQQLRRLLSVPIFNSLHGLEFGSADIMECAPLQVTVAEYSRHSLLFVAGTPIALPMDPLHQLSDPSPRRHSFTLVIGADTNPPPLPLATPSSVLLLHLTYLSTPPFPDVQPERCILVGGRRGAHGAQRGSSDLDVLPVSVVVNSGDSIRIVTAARRHGVQRHMRFGTEHYDLDARIERRDTCGELLECDDVEVIQASWDAEQYLSDLLASLSTRRCHDTTQDGSGAVGKLVLRDYDVRIIDSLAHPHCGDWPPSWGCGISSSATAASMARSQSHGLAPRCSRCPGAFGGCGQDCVAIGIVAVVAATSEVEGRTLMLGHLLLLDSRAGKVLTLDPRPKSLNPKP